MTLDELKASLSDRRPPAGLPPLVTALWYDAKGHWDEAHRIAQDVHDVNGSWVHAYLHRREGDIANAGYWYRRAGRPEEEDALELEWDRIATELLKL